MNKRIKVLVTGANGQLGKTLRDQSLLNKTIEWFFYTSTALDITNKEQVDKIFRDREFDYCINCAAYTNVELAEEEQELAMAVNFEGVQNIVDAVKQKETVFIHISTDYVFDGTKEKAYLEDDIPNPINVYGTSKLLGERYIIDNLKSYYIIRTSWLYSKFGKNFYTAIRSKLLKNEPLKVTNAQIGSPTSTKDLSNALIHIIKNNKKRYGIFHFSNSGLTNWYIFAKTIIELSDAKKLNQLFETKEFKTKAKRPKNSQLDSSKFTKVFNYEIADWKDSLAQVINTS